MYVHSKFKNLNEYRFFLYICTCLLSIAVRGNINIIHFTQHAILLNLNMRAKLNDITGVAALDKPVKNALCSKNFRTVHIILHVWYIYN